MVDETIPEKCEKLYNKLNTFVESEISRDVTPQISNLNSRINALEPNLVRVKEVSGNISSVSAGGTSTKTFTVPACPSGYKGKYFSTSTGWGTVSSVSLSGTTLTVTLLNVSNSSHNISFSGVLMYYPTTIEAEQHISISATNPYLLEGEVTDLVVSLVDEFGLPLSGKTVTISDGTSVYSGITDNNGAYTKTGVSVSQDTTFTATYSNVSDSVTVEYCTFVDYCTRTNNKSSGYYQPRGTYSLDDEGLTITADSTQFNFREYNGEITIPYKIRFELLNNTDNSTIVYFYNGNYSESKASGTIYRVNNQPTMVEFTVTSSGITRKIGDTSTELTISGTIGSTVSFRFGNTNANSSIKYRNFRIKPVSQ